MRVKSIPFFYFYLYFFLSFYSFSQNPEKPYVILISFDGFRYDYAQKYNAKNILAMGKEGVTTEALLPSYPSKTHPNHYTLVTGMHPGNNGLVDNIFYSPKEKEVFINSNQKFAGEPKWYGGIPLWQLTQKNGMKAASYFWIGSEAPIAGEYISYFYKYKDRWQDAPLQRINQAIQWLSMPEKERPHLITLYFSLVDDAGHEFGVNTDKIEKSVLKADSLIGYLRNELKKIDLPINLILVSDHGMIDMPNESTHFLELESLANVSDSSINYTSSGFHSMIYVKNKDLKEKIYKELKNSPQKEKYNVYLRENTPIHWHYRKSDNVGDIVIEAKFPYYIGGKNYLNKVKKQIRIGQHGYDVKKHIEMAGIFFAVGPNIKPQNKPLPPIENVNIYTLVTSILELKYTHKIDGKKKTWKNVYQKIKR